MIAKQCLDLGLKLRRGLGVQVSLADVEHHADALRQLVQEDAMNRAERLEAGQFRDRAHLAAGTFGGRVQTVGQGFEGRRHVLSGNVPDARAAGDAVLPASDAVREIMGAASVNPVGYCIGGTLLAMTLAYLAARGDDRHRHWPRHDHGEDGTRRRRDANRTNPQLSPDNRPRRR